MTIIRPRIERLGLTGYKSVRSAEIEFSALNVLIGANGVGKSNLVSFFAFLSASLDAKLDDYVGRYGGPNSLLHLGARTTGEISAAVTVATEAGTGVLHQRCNFRAPDSLYYSNNHAGRPANSDRSDELVIDDLCAIVKQSGTGHPGQLIYTSLKDKTSAYHLLDTGLTSPIRTEVYVNDNQCLRSDGGNLAAMLYLYKKQEQEHRKPSYRRIRTTVRKIVPMFDDFVLEPSRLNPNSILLNWKQLGSDYVLGPHQMSDGSLRAVALIAALLQPDDNLPDLLMLDEPELGLHPYAISILAGLIRAASSKTQVVVSTQSAALVDEFAAEEVIVVESENQQSRFCRLDPEMLKDWLSEYSLGELWEKNVIGGGPLS